MADFCGQCSKKMFGFIEYLPKNIPEGCVEKMLCEGCGKIVFLDMSGLRVGCQFCTHPEGGVCPFAGEIGDDFFCEHFTRRD
jgi:hypothetical protein